MERTAGAESVNLAGEQEQDKAQGEQGTQTQTHSRGHCELPSGDVLEAK